MAPAATGSPDAAAQAVAAAPAAGDSVDLLKVIALPVAKRFGPVVLAAAAAGLVGFAVGRRKRSPQPGTDELLRALLTRLSS